MQKHYHTYHWAGRNQHGKKLHGIISAPNKIAAKMNLCAQNIYIKTLKRQYINIGLYKITEQDIYLFYKQLLTLIISGIPLLKCLDIIRSNQKNIKFSNIINNIKISINSGNSLASTFAQYPKLFNKLSCNLMAIGEQSGTLDIMLQRIILYQEKHKILKNKIKSAITYPISICIVTLIVTIILMIFVIPQFNLLFANLNTKLPLSTLIIIKIATYFQKYCLLGIIITISISYMIFYMQKKILKIKYLIDLFLLKVPIIGDIIKKSIIARLLYILYITYTAGLSLVEALQLALNIIDNTLYNQAIHKIYKDIITGQQLQYALKNTLLFPDFVVQMISIGEESGTLDKIFNHIAICYEDEIDYQINTLRNLFDPIIMTILGIIIGGIIIIMYLPIFQLGVAI